MWASSPVEVITTDLCSKDLISDLLIPKTLFAICCEKYLSKCGRRVTRLCAAFVSRSAGEREVLAPNIFTEQLRTVQCLSFVVRPLRGAA